LCDRLAYAAPGRFLRSAGQVAVEEGGDALVGVAGGGLVVAGTGDLGEHRQQECLVGGVMVVNEPVRGLRVDLDVVVDAERGEGAFQPWRGAGALGERSRPP